MVSPYAQNFYFCDLLFRKFPVPCAEGLEARSCKPEPETMKQKVNGQRVINWHRPLGKDEFRQSYLRHKDAPLAEDLDTTKIIDLTHPDACDCSACMYKMGYWGAAPIDFARQEIRNMVSESNCVTMGEFIRPELRERWVQSANEQHAESVGNSEAKIQENVTKNLLALKKYMEVRGKPNRLIPEFLERSLEQEDDLDLVPQIVSNGLQSQENFLIELLLLHPFWVRSLSNWKDPGTAPLERLTSLLNHLLVIYPVQDFFYREWKGYNISIESNWMQWFIMQAQGVSIYKVAKDFGWDVSRNYLRALTQVSGNWDFDEACEIARYMVLGIPEEIHPVVLEWGDLYYDPLSPCSTWQDNRFQERSITWISRNYQSLTEDDLHLVLAWVSSLRENSSREELGRFSWKGRSPARVLELCRRWVEDSHREKDKQMEWKPRGWDWRWTEENGKIWTISELWNGRLLIFEGVNMHHCVGDYVTRCVQGKSAIFSLQCDGKRKATVEVNPSTKKIVFAAGHCNRDLHSEEQEILDVWIEKVQNKPKHQRLKSA